MVILYILIVVLCLWGLGIRKESKGDYLSREQGNAIKGIFILMVFVSHANGYIRDAGYSYPYLSDTLFTAIKDYFGQLIVVMFLFFSGYGVMHSIRDKGKVYVTSMPRHRILNTLLNFDIAVIWYALIQVLIGNVFSTKQYLLSFIAWESIGNSNWYIFVIMLCYLASWCAASISQNGKDVLVYTFSLLVVSYVFLFFTKDAYWYNIIVAYPLGMAACLCKNKLDVLSNSRYWWLVLMVGFACFVFTYSFHQDSFGIVVSSRSLFFALVIVLLLMKIKVGNSALNWLGKNLFPLYIYQRIPMLLLAHFNPWGIITGHPIVFVLLSLLLTVLIVPLVNKIQIKL